MGASWSNDFYLWYDASMARYWLQQIAQKSADEADKIAE
jgi:hypothetical protein